MFHVKQSTENDKIFHKIIDLLLRENQIHNLSGIKDWQGMYDQHILDSLAVSDYISTLSDSNINVLDLGSGAGFPGLVIAINNPNKKVTMIDSNRKKTTFINLVLKELQINNATALNSRIEDIGCPENANIVCAKALAPLDVLLEYASPLLKFGGILIAMKSSDIDEEASNASLVASHLGFGDFKKMPYSLFQRNRQLLVFTKTKNSKIKLPRKNGEARNKPLRSKLCA